MKKITAKVGVHGSHINPSHRKENGFAKAFMVIGAGQRKEAICARIYWSSTYSTCYACIWTNHHNAKTGVSYHMSGSGKAGGYNYHRESAALDAAIRKTGFELNQPIDGRGDGAMREALLAMGRAIGLRNPFIIEAHA